MERPYTLFIYSLKVIPNTELEKAMKERGVDIEEISATFMSIPPRVNNLLLYLLCIWRPPLWLWKRLLSRVRASTEEQKLYPRLGHVLRTAYLSRRALSHLVKMDFSAIPGRSGYIAWRIGLIGAVAQALHRAHAAPAAPRARDRQGRPRGPRRRGRGAGGAAQRLGVARVASARRGRGRVAAELAARPRRVRAAARAALLGVGELDPDAVALSWSMSPTYCSSTELTPTSFGGGSACHFGELLERAGMDLVAREVELELGLDGASARRFAPSRPVPAAGSFGSCHSTRSARIATYSGAVAPESSTARIVTP